MADKIGATNLLAHTFYNLFWIYDGHPFLRVACQQYYIILQIYLFFKTYSFKFKSSITLIRSCTIVYICGRQNNDLFFIYGQLLLRVGCQYFAEISHLTETKQNDGLHIFKHKSSKARWPLPPEAQAA